jgi:hypothetical protein
VAYAGCRASFKFCMGDKLREETEEGKRHDTFQVHFNVHTPSKILSSQTILKIVGHLQK